MSGGTGRRGLLLLLVILVISGPAGAGPAPDGGMRRVRALFGNKRYAEVLRELTPLLAAPGASKETLVLAVRSAIRLGQLDRSRELAARLLALPGADGPYYAGMVESSSGAFDKALTYYARALAREPGHRGARRETVRALCHLGRGAMRRQDLPAARQLMERARRVDPRASVVDRNLALIELRSGRPERALVPLRRVLGRDPADPVAHRLAGRALATTGKLQLARGHLQKAVATGHKLGPEGHARILMLSGVVRARLGQLFSAMVDLTQAANELGDSHPELLAQVKVRLARVRMALGIEQLRRGQERAAGRSLRGALTACAGLPLSERQEIEQAVALGAAVRGGLERARKLVPGLKADVGPVLRAAYVPVAAGLVDAYTDCYSTDSDRQLRAATSFEQMAGRVTDAARDKLLAVAVRCRLRAAATLYRAGSVAEAREIYEQTLAGVADPPSAWRHNAAVLEYASGHRESTIATLERLRAKIPLAACNLAVHREHTYVPYKAYQLFKECKKRGASFPGLDEILKAKKRAFEGGGR